MALESITIPNLTSVMQFEYDRHMDSYMRGCIGCINAAIAIRDMARFLSIELIENERTKTFPPNAAR